MWPFALLSLLGAVPVTSFAISLPSSDRQSIVGRQASAIPFGNITLTPDTIPGLLVTPPELYPGILGSGGPLHAVTSNPPNVTLPQSLVPEVLIEKAQVFNNTLRKKIRYGPFRLPGTNEVTWESKAGNSGMADEYIPRIRKPCSACMIASISAGLELADGTVAPSSAWLHHSVLINAGPKVRDPICNTSNTETIFSSGNEKSVTRYSLLDESVKAGYRLHAEDTVTIAAEFMNELETPQWVWLAISYEYYDGDRPDFKNTHISWLSVGQTLNCNLTATNPFGPSNLTASGNPKSLIFSEHSTPWTSPISATVLGVGGHAHDGAQGIDVYQNDKNICHINVTYGLGSDNSMGGDGDSASNNANMEHIQSMSTCHLMTPVAKGDTFYLAANYNFTEHPGMLNNKGDLDEIMGIATVLLVE